MMDKKDRGVILKRAWKDNRKIIQSGGFQTPITITCAKDAKDYEITAFLVDHSNTIDPDTGLTIISRKVVLSINMSALIDIDYPLYANIDKGTQEKYPLVSAGEVTMRGDKISYYNSSEEYKEVRVEETMTDYTLDYLTLKTVLINTIKKTEGLGIGINRHK